MGNYAGDEYIAIKKWVADKIGSGYSWDDVVTLCVGADVAVREFDYLQNEELIIPPNMQFSDWEDFVRTTEQNFSRIVEMYGIGKEKTNTYPVPTDNGSAYLRYKNHLLGKYDGKQKMSGTAVDAIENNSHWILNHLERDTRTSGPVKGLVMGSVQSGKTANMIGLVTMAADYDWNIFIVLSGTIDNLRKQTRDRFFSDLTKSGGLSWHVLDYTSNPDYMLDIGKNERYTIDDLSLNAFQDGESTNTWLHRYVFVCLKNPSRLRRLITWLHSKKPRAARMRVVVIDDEADQASVNTAKMTFPQSEEEIERTTINQLIIDLVQGCDCEGNPSQNPFQAMNYISFTATPYANVLNEAYRESLYPSNFICSLPESEEYFGPKAIWGSKDDENYSGLNIIRTVSDDEMKLVQQVHKHPVLSLPTEFKRSVAWFLCAAAILRQRGHIKPISMLIHTTAIQDGHFEEYELLKQWLSESYINGSLLLLCRDVYGEEANAFRLKDLKEGFPKYANMENVNDDFPEFDLIENEIRAIVGDVVNIGLGDDKQFVYHDNGIHLCVDNCKANRLADDGTYLRIVYPSSKELAKMEKAPVFIILGGNTLARGLTLEGLVCTYFARNVNQSDTLMQMARWFGYRHGYELLQRIWMPIQVQRKFELIEEIDEKLKKEFEAFMKMGKSPDQFGPRIMSSSSISRFLLTSKNKSQNMIPCDVDFSGDSYEITQFDDSKIDLINNINLAESFLNGIGTAKQSGVIESSYVWRDVDSSYVLNGFLKGYIISKCSALHSNIPLFIDWIQEMNSEGQYLKWNVVLAGNSKSTERWTVAGADVGTIERSKKQKSDCIDIGALRSGTDILSDIQIDLLSEEQKQVFESRKKSKKNLVSLRYEMGLADTPLLLLYRIDRNKGKETSYKGPLNSTEDIVAFSIVVPGQDANTDFIRTVQVRRPE